MSAVLIPMFPLTILPLPGELVPLHIFEPRYKALLNDAEKGVTFGIYFSHELNAQKIGSLMKLESIIKRYPGGEADIVVRCEDIFNMDVLYRTYEEKLYPGGDVHLWKLDMEVYPGEHLREIFMEYMSMKKGSQELSPSTLYQIANALHLDFTDRYNFLLADESSREKILLTRLKFLVHVLQQEIKSKDVFHLN